MSPDRASFELALFASASRSIAAFLADVCVEQLSWPSPCCGWDGRTVVNHIVGTAHLFAASAREAPPPLPEWERVPDIVGDDPEEVYVMAAGAVHSAFSRGAVIHGDIWLPQAPVSARTALRVLMADHVTHAWDLSRCTGRSVELDEAVITLALETFRATLGPDLRHAGYYGPEVTPPPQAPPIDRLAAFTGRAV